MLVTSGEPYTPDIVIAHARNLHPYRNIVRQPTASVKIEFPAFLARELKTLDCFGAEIARRQRKGTRRSITFDDAAQTLYIDICKPGETNWHRVEFQTALDLKRRKTNETVRTSQRELESPNVPRGTGAGGPSTLGAKPTHVHEQSVDVRVRLLEENDTLNTVLSNEINAVTHNPSYL